MVKMSSGGQDAKFFARVRAHVAYTHLKRKPFFNCHLSCLSTVPGEIHDIARNLEPMKSTLLSA